MNTFKSYFLFKAPFRSLYFLFFLSILLILSSCAPKSRTITPLSQSNLSKIKKIAVLVKADVEFSVSVEKEKGYWSAVLSDWGEGIMDHSAGYGGMVGVPFFLLGIVGGLTEYGIKSYIDEKHKGSLEAKLTQLHPNELLSDRLKHYLESSNAGFTAVISETDSRDSLRSNGFDTILVINMKEWQVTLCPMPYRNRQSLG